MKTSNTNIATAQEITAQTGADLKNAVLIVSVFTNLFVLTTWLVVQTSA